MGIFQSYKKLTLIQSFDMFFEGQVKLGKKCMLFLLEKEI